MGLIYWCMKKFAQAIISMYFRKIHVVGQSNIPESGPIIICGNHANQFIDALIIGSFVSNQLSFTIAAGSFKKTVIGWMAKAVNAIPVKRPEDHKVKGIGKVKILSKTNLIGINTNFQNSLEGNSILINKVIITVIKVIDKENLEIKYTDGLDNLISDNEHEYYVS
jgi:glycerol-3-phosphate O-acyltransferase/dihydroxyacetone phosphate acyltransferase